MTSAQTVWNCPYVYDSCGRRFRVDTVIIALVDDSGVRHRARLSPRGGLRAVGGEMYIGIAALRELATKKVAVRPVDPKAWTALDETSRSAAATASAKTAIRNLSRLFNEGYGIDDIRALPSADLDALLCRVAPDGTARLSAHTTHDGLPVIMVSNAAMGKAFMALGYNVDLVCDDLLEHVILENSVNDLQDELRRYVAVTDPADLVRDPVFLAWAERVGVDMTGATPETISRVAREFAETYEVNMCLYYRKGVNVFCGGNIGVSRANMPQLAGPTASVDALIVRAMRAGLEKPDEYYRLDETALVGSDDVDAIRALAHDPDLVVALAAKDDPRAERLLSVVDWERTGANLESHLHKAARALGIEVEEPRLVDPLTMLSSQNELKGTTVEDIADKAVRAVTMLVAELERRGESTSDDNIARILCDTALRRAYGVVDPDAENPDFSALLWAPTMTAGRPGTQLYMLDGHHRWSGLMLANRKLAQTGSPHQVRLLIRNYQTDIREALEIGRVVQKEFGVKDMRLSGDEAFGAGEPAPVGREDYLARTEAFYGTEIRKRLVEMRQSPENPFRRVREPAAHLLHERPQIATILPGRPTLRPVIAENAAPSRDGGESVLMEYSSPDGVVVPLVIYPDRCRGTQGRNLGRGQPGRETDPVTGRVLAMEQIRTIPSGKRHWAVARRRIASELELLDDGDIAGVLEEGDAYLHLVAFFDAPLRNVLASLGRVRDLAALDASDMRAYALLEHQ